MNDMSNSKLIYPTILEKILTNISDIIVIIGKDGIVTYNSPNIEKLFGWKPKEIIGKTVWGNMHPEDIDSAKELFNISIKEDGASGEIECRYRCKDGTYKWIRFTGTNLLNDNEINGILGNYHYIGENKKTEEALLVSEQRVKHNLKEILSPQEDISVLELSDIIDSEKIQEVMDEFYRLTNIGIGIIDVTGKVLVATGWQDICQKFHRVNPQSCSFCLESDLELSSKVPVGTFKMYRCKNSMWDIATPIMLGEKHVGNIFLGQFLFDDEIPDLEVFRQQAKNYGFNEEEYLAALEKLPRWSKETVDAAMKFYSGFAELISNLGYGNIKLVNALEEQKRIEQALAEHESFLNSIVENIPNMLFIKDAEDLRFVRFNKAGEELLGFDRNELIGKNDYDFFTKEQADFFTQNDRQVLNNGKMVDIPEESINTKTGQRIIHTKKIPILGSDGRPVYLLGISEDITDRKNAEVELRKSQEYLSIITNSIDDIIYSVNGETGEFDYLSPVFEKKLGYTLSDIKQMGGRWKFLLKIIEGMDSSLPDPVLSDFKLNRKSTAPVWSHWWRAKDGTLLFLEDRSVPVLEEGRFTRIDGVMRDITEQKKAEEEVIRSDSILKATLESIDEGLLIVNDDGKVTHANRKFKEIFNIPNDLFNTKDDSKLISYAKNQLYDPAVFSSNVEKIYESKTPSEDLLFFKDKRIIARYSYPLQKESPVKGRVWLFRDITEKKQNEEELKKFKLAIENSGDAVYWVNDEGGFDYINERACTMLGYSHDELIQLNLTDIVPGYSMEYLTRNLERLKNNKRNEWNNLESIHRKKNGETIPVEVSSLFFWMDNKGILISYVRDITERKKAEEELLRNQKLLTESQRIAQMGSWELDLNNHNLFWNEEAYRIYGYKYKEIKPNLELFTELVHPDDREKVKGHFEFTLKTKEFHDFECRIIQPDGKIVYIVVAGEIILDENANPVKTFGIVQDITEQKKAVEELTRSAKEKESLMKSMASAFVMWEPVYDDNDGIIDVRFAYINEAYERMTGVKHEDVLGKRILDVWPNTELDWFDIFNEVIETRELISFDKYFTPTDSYYSCAAYLPWNTNDRLCVVFDDITERIKYEDALKKRVLALTQPMNDIKEIVFTDLFNIDDLQKIQDTFADATGVASLITSPDGAPITKPSNFCGLCNLIRSTEIGKANCFKSDALIGKQNSTGPTIQPCISGGLWDAGASITLGGVHIANWLVGQVRNEAQDEKEMLKYAEEIGVDKELYLNEFKKVKKMSKEQFEKVSKSLYTLANELSLKAYQNVQQARFISQQKNSEEEIRKLNAELEKRVEERTAQLQQANKDLESFAYSVSHDLRAPIRHINGFLRLLENSVESEETKVKDYFRKIETSSRGMSVMIDELLKFSRLGRSQLHYQYLDLREIVDDILVRFQPDYAERNIEWKINKLPNINGDPVLIKIALENLISNAIKYTAQKELSEIELGESETTPDSSGFYVKDNGVGFDMAYKNKLFGVFQRLHNHSEFEGVGIGLANVKQIILKHKGSITAESKPNEGATFFITLPK